MEEQVFQCPVCKHHNHKLYVNTDKGLFNCFHCGFAGSIEKLRKYPSIWSKIEDQASLSVYSKLLFTPGKELKLNDTLLKSLKPFHEISEDDLEYDYLVSRGWDADIIDCYDVLVSDNDNFINRVFITIQNDKGDTVFYTGRSVIEGINPKYWNSIVPKDFVFRAKTPVDDFYTDNAYICEGVFDAFKLPGGIALLGKTLAKDQHKSLFSALKNKKNIYLCLDPGTQRETKAIARELDSWFPNKKIFILNWKDEKKKDLGDKARELSRSELITFIEENSGHFSTRLFR
jgi:hypothetical protein